MRREAHDALRRRARASTVAPASSSHDRIGAQRMRSAPRAAARAPHTRRQRAATASSQRDANAAEDGRAAGGESRPRARSSCRTRCWRAANSVHVAVDDRHSAVRLTMRVAAHLHEVRRVVVAQRRRDELGAELHRAHGIERASPRRAARARRGSRLPVASSSGDCRSSDAAIDAPLSKRAVERRSVTPSASRCRRSAARS